jgi:AraC family transcriptional regulator, regulatory protein of adaptative response / DNA-3-methyladenine glycosylase II
MTLDPDACYRALETADRRFDGVFFTGVRTTGIYCRPICTARLPRRESCTFYPNAAAAERAGYRPCLRCRPELAPGNAPVDACGRVAALAAARIQAGALNGEGSIEALAAGLGLSSRHLRRVVEQQLGVTPVELAQTRRLLLAKQLLTETTLPITEVAFSAGFASIRRFNALFQERYSLNPTTLRRTAGAAGTADSLTLRLAYRPPLDWPALLGFLGARATAGVEAVEDDRYLRTVHLGKHSGWVAVRADASRHMLLVEVARSLAPVLMPLLARLRELFDLDAHPEAIARHLGADPVLGPLVARHPGLRVPGAFDGFELATRAVLGQQVSVKGATTLAGRFTAAFGEPIATPFPALTRLSPEPDTVAAADVAEIAAIGMPRSRALTLASLARATACGAVDLSRSADPEAAVRCLTRLPGIGEWTAQYIAMRALRWPDAFPHTDLGLKHALGGLTPAAILNAAETWRPWRSYATLHLWQSLSPQGVPA